MAAITNFATLQSAFEDYLARPDLSEFLPNFIHVTEKWLNRKLRTREMMASAGLIAQVGGYSLPTDYIEWVAAQWVDPAAPQRVLSLRYVEPDSPEFRHRYRPNGSPQYFTVLDGQLQTRSMKAGNLTLSYYRQIPPLTSASPTNWLLDQAPEIYLYGVIAEAYRFQKDVDRNAEWSDAMQKHLADLMGQGDSQKTGRRAARAAEDAAEAVAAKAVG